MRANPNTGQRLPVTSMQIARRNNAVENFARQGAAAGNARRILVDEFNYSTDELFAILRRAGVSWAQGR